jgi:hypothetical protein
MKTNPFRRPALLALCTFALGSMSIAANAQVAGQVQWNTDGKPPLNFSPKAAVGVYVAKSSNFQIIFFADTLSAEEERYWVARQAAVFQGKFEGKTFKADPAMDAKLKAHVEKSVSLWSKLADTSKHKGTLPAVHEMKDMAGVGICVGFNCTYYSGGVHGDDYAAQVKSLKVPTPTGAAAKQTASLDVALKKSDAGAPAKTINLKGDLPFHVVHE